MEDFETITPSLQSGLLGSLGRFIGESPEATQRAFQGALPASMYAIADRGSTEAGARSLIDGFRRRSLPELDMKDLGQLLSNDDASDRMMASSGGFLESLLGSRWSGLLDGLGRHGNIGRGGAARLLSLCAPLALGLIGRRVREDRLDGAGLARFFGQQKGQLARSVPGALGGLLGISMPVEKPRVEPVRVAARPAVVETRTPVIAPRAAIAEPEPWRRWLPWALAGLAALIGIGLLTGRGRRVNTRAIAPPIVVAPPPPIAPASPPPLTLEPVKPPALAEPSGLPESATESATEAPEATTAVAATPLESELNTYLAGTGVESKMITLKGFATAADDLTGENKATADAIASAMKQNPGSTARIEGHTDSQGTAAMNEGLSKNRAEELKGYLVSEGVDSDRLQTTGRSYDDPVASNDTAEGRAENRRVVVVLHR